MDTGFTVQNYSHYMPLEVQLIKPRCHFRSVIEQNGPGSDNTSTDVPPYRGEYESRKDKRMAFKSVCTDIKVFMVVLNVSRSLDGSCCFTSGHTHTHLCVTSGERQLVAVRFKTLVGKRANSI